MIHLWVFLHASLAWFSLALFCDQKRSWNSEKLLSPMLGTKGTLLCTAFGGSNSSALPSSPCSASTVFLCSEGQTFWRSQTHCLCTAWLCWQAQSGQRQALVVLSGTHSESRRGRRALLLVCLTPGYMDTFQFLRSPWTDHKCSPPEWW